MKYCKDCVGFDECNTTGRTVKFAVDDGVCIDFDERKPQTNADKIRSMSDEELAEFIRSMVDGSNSHPVACSGCINYGTHHSDPANKGTYLYECDGCENEGIGLDVLMWLQQPAEKPKEAF